MTICCPRRWQSPDGHRWLPWRIATHEDNCGAGRETTPFLAFVALAVLLSFWLSALYRAGGCAFSCCLLHALANTLIGALSLSSISLVIAAALALTGLSLAAFRRRLPIEEVCGGKPEWPAP